MIVNMNFGIIKIELISLKIITLKEKKTCDTELSTIMKKFIKKKKSMPIFFFV